jgi:hydroxymethylbilane synthase
VTPKFRLAAVGDPGALAPLARLTRVLEPRTAIRSAVVVTIEPSGPAGRPLDVVAPKLAAGQIDVALCGGSRLPLTLPEGIRIAAVMRCRDPHYRFVSLRHVHLSLMPSGSKVAVSDTAARAQIRHRFPALRIEMAPAPDILTAGLRHGLWDAACVPPEVLGSDADLVARAVPVPIEEILPAVGQGVVVVLVAGSGRTLDHLHALNDAAAEDCFRVERAFLARVAGVRGATAVARAARIGGCLELTGLLAEDEGRWLAADRTRGPARLGEVFAQEIADACTRLAVGRKEPSTS